MFDISVQVLCSTSSAMHVRSAPGTCIIMRVLILIKGTYYQTQLRRGAYRKEGAKSNHLGIRFCSHPCQIRL